MNSYVGKGTNCKITIDFDVVNIKVETISSEPAVQDLGGKTFWWWKTTR
jgi:hypothetical protein